MINDYVRVGGVTAANNALSWYYVQNLDCPFDRIREGCWCDTTLDLPGEIGTAPLITQAPWYDPTLPDLSSRFYGLFVFDVKGLRDTNRSVQVVEGIDDGAWMGRSRRTARQMRVTGMLIARGEDALDYGLAWLSAVLDGDRCGQHQEACGVTDVEFLTDCPPPRGLVTEIIDGQPVSRLQTDEEYEVVVAPYRRFFHDVVCTSGPLEKRRSSRDGWDMLDVEFTLTAGRPWVYTGTRFPALPVTGSTVFEDRAHNLVPYTSAEIGGDPVTVATNYSVNPSVEVDGSSWGSLVDGTNITSGMVVSGRVTGELQAVGLAAFRGEFTATGAGADGWFALAQTVDITARPADARMSITLWAAQLLMEGTADRQETEVIAAWRETAGGANLRQDNLGTIPVDGGSVTVADLVPPEGADFVQVRAAARMTSWDADTVLRLYVDALRVGTP